jgi:HEAT repeat protein
LGYKKDSNIRKDAVDALGYLGESSAVEPLINVLRDDDTDIRNKAAEALRHIGDEKAIASLKKASKDKAISKYAIEILKKIAEDCTAAFIAAELNTRDGRCGKCVVLCAKIGELAVEPITKAFADRYEGTLYYARKAILKIGKSAIQALITAIADKGKDTWIRMECVDILAEIGDKKAVEPLINALKDKDAFVRQAAAKSLGKMSDTRAIEPLIKVLDDKVSTVREAAAEALEIIGKPSAPLIAESFKSKKHINKESIALLKNLGIGDEAGVAEKINQSIEPLIKALKDENSTIREEAAEALGETGDKRAIEPLIHALEDDDSLVLNSAVKALGKIGDKKAVQPLIQIFESKEPWIQEKAAEALVKIGDKRVVEVLIKALDDPSKRTIAASALGQLGDESAIQPLENIYKEPLMGIDPFFYVDDVKGEMRREKEIRAAVKEAILNIKKQLK